MADSGATPAAARRKRPAEDTEGGGHAVSKRRKNNGGVATEAKDTVGAASAAAEAADAADAKHTVDAAEAKDTTSAATASNVHTEKWSRTKAFLEAWRDQHGTQGHATLEHGGNRFQLTGRLVPHRDATTVIVCHSTQLGHLEADLRSGSPPSGRLGAVACIQFTASVEVKEVHRLEEQTGMPLHALDSTASSATTVAAFYRATNPEQQQPDGNFNLVPVAIRVDQAERCLLMRPNKWRAITKKTALSHPNLPLALAAACFIAADLDAALPKPNAYDRRRLRTPDLGILVGGLWTKDTEGNLHCTAPTPVPVREAVSHAWLLSCQAARHRAENLADILAAQLLPLTDTMLQIYGMCLRALHPLQVAGVDHLTTHILDCIQAIDTARQASVDLDHGTVGGLPRLSQTVLQYLHAALHAVSSECAAPTICDGLMSSQDVLLPDGNNVLVDVVDALEERLAVRNRSRNPRNPHDRDNDPHGILRGGGERAASNIDRAVQQERASAEDALRQQELQLQHQEQQRQLLEAQQRQRGRSQGLLRMLAAAEVKNPTRRPLAMSVPQILEAEGFFGSRQDTSWMSSSGRDSMFGSGETGWQVRTMTAPLTPLTSLAAQPGCPEGCRPPTRRHQLPRSRRPAAAHTLCAPSNGRATGAGERRSNSTRDGGLAECSGRSQHGSSINRAQGRGEPEYCQVDLGSPRGT